MANGSPSSKRSILASLRDTMRLEAETIRNTALLLGEPHCKAVRLMATCRGKVIVTGIGKSGIIAQKIASTLASTGTPAIFMHPSEGMHGDLGLVEKKDLVLAVGKSGESTELNTILPVLRRIGVKIIAVTGSASSTLGKHAHVVLLTPAEQEACPLNLAPTCSTTAALAVGDALAVALMKLRRFRKEHFAFLHPGGQLGKRLTLRVKDVMRRGDDNPIIPLDAGVPEMLVQITRKHAGAVSVVDERGRLRGLVTDYDIRRALQAGKDLSKLSIRDIMNPNPARIQDDCLAMEAVEMMSDRQRPFSVLPVVDAKGRAVGMVQIHDIRGLGL